MIWFHLSERNINAGGQSLLRFFFLTKWVWGGIHYSDGWTAGCRSVLYICLSVHCAGHALIDFHTISDIVVSLASHSLKESLLLFCLKHNGHFKYHFSSRERWSETYTIAPFPALIIQEGDFTTLAIHYISSPLKLMVRNW